MSRAILSIAVSLLFSVNAYSAAPDKILILDNDSLIVGNIRRVGDQFHIQRGISETIIPAARVIDVVDDLHAAFRTMRQRCNRRDFDDRLRLIHWCLENGLKAEALAEAESLKPFRPDDQKLRVLIEGLRTLKTTAVPPTPAPARLPDKVLEIEPPTYNRDAYAPFTAKVQPILMNACVSCHGTGRGGNFNLVRITDADDRKATALNLAATLKQINAVDIVSSPLLVKSIAAHGKSMQPPLRGQESPAFQNLAAWVALAAPQPAAADSSPGVPAKSVIEQPSTLPKSIFGETSTSQPKPEPQTTPKDPFDPAIFNGTIQPKKE